MKKKDKACARIADRIAAHRQTYGRNSLKRIHMSKPLFVFIVGKTRAAKLLKEKTITLFGIETVVYDSDEMEYSFTEYVFEAEL